MLPAYANKEIAPELALSEDSVKANLWTGFSKLDVVKRGFIPA